MFATTAMLANAEFPGKASVCISPCGEHEVPSCAQDVHPQLRRRLYVTWTDLEKNYEDSFGLMLRCRIEGIAAGRSGLCSTDLTSSNLCKDILKYLYSPKWRPSCVLLLQRLEPQVYGLPESFFLEVQAYFVVNGHFRCVLTYGSFPK